MLFLVIAVVLGLVGLSIYRLRPLTSREAVELANAYLEERCKQYPYWYDLHVTEVKQVYSNSMFVWFGEMIETQNDHLLGRDKLIGVEICRWTRKCHIITWRR